MGKGRLEAFSDGVIAIIITIMVLEMKVPHGETLDAVKPLLPVFLSYVLSFVYVGIYWNNHHHMLHACTARHRRGAVGQPAPAVLAVAFPFRHRLDGREPFRAAALGLLRSRAADGGLRLLDPAAGDHRRAGSAVDPESSRRRRLEGQAVAGAVSRSRSPRRSSCSWIAQALYVAVALIWLIPDRRIERVLQRVERE